MNQLLLSIVSFVLVVGVLITVHEFGHFWVARKLGIKVLRFSIGFGKPLLKRVGRDGTEYVLAAIPLGGYVKMLDEREGDVAEDQLAFAFNRKPLAARMAVVVAGPLFNFILAIFAYWLMFMHGAPGVRPLIGEVAPQTIAFEAGFQRGDEIVAIDGVDMATWEQTLFSLMQGALQQRTLEVEFIREERGRLTYPLEMAEVPDALKQNNLLANLGLSIWRPEIEPRLAHLGENGPAVRAGFLVGDLIVAADGEAIAEWGAWTEYVRARPGERVSVGLIRAGERITLPLQLESRGRCGNPYGYMGASASMPAGYAERMRVVVEHPPIEALSQSLARTWDISLLSLRMVGKMVLGEVSLENLSGPVTIARYAGESSRIGLSALLSFMALVSISLGVLNLLPIPVLDGGHLLYYLVEFVRGSPLSEQAQEVGQRVGIALLLMLMTLALYNDLLRLFC